MQHQLDTPSESREETPWYVSPVAISGEADEIANAPIEDFLEQVTGRLLSLPFSQREEIRRELRQHLTASIAAHQEIGDTPESAAQSAIRAFGKPKTIAARFRRAYETTGQGMAASTLSTFRYTLNQFILVKLGSQLLIGTLVVVFMMLSLMLTLGSGKFILHQLLSPSQNLISVLLAACFVLAGNFGTRKIPQSRFLGLSLGCVISIVGVWLITLVLGRPNLHGRPDPFVFHAQAVAIILFFFLYAGALRLSHRVWNVGQ